MAAPSPNAPTTPSRPAANGGMIPKEWSVQAADKVIDTVALVRDKTTRPAQVAARGLVYGLMAAVVGLTALVLVVVMLFRLGADLIPGDLWIVYAVLSVLFIGLGLVFLRKANRPAAPATD